MQQHSMYWNIPANRTCRAQFRKLSFSQTPHGGKMKQLSIEKSAEKKKLISTRSIAKTFLFQFLPILASIDTKNDASMTTMQTIPRNFVFFRFGCCFGWWSREGELMDCFECLIRLQIEHTTDGAFEICLRFYNGKWMRLEVFNGILQYTVARRDSIPLFVDSFTQWLFVCLILFWYSTRASCYHEMYFIHGLFSKRRFIQFGYLFCHRKIDIMLPFQTMSIS